MREERAEREPGDGRGDHLPLAPEHLRPRRHRPLRRRAFLALGQPRRHHGPGAGRLLGHGERQHGAVEAAGHPVGVGRLRQLEHLVEPHVTGGALAADRQPPAGVHLHLEVLLLEPCVHARRSHETRVHISAQELTTNHKLACSNYVPEAEAEGVGGGAVEALDLGVDVGDAGIPLRRSLLRLAAGHVDRKCWRVALDLMLLRPVIDGWKDDGDESNNRWVGQLKYVAL